MYFRGYASMGGSHSNYYKCSNCGRVVEIYDRDLDYTEPKRKTTKQF
jgi:anaerobic ribonucleoside-triphosphate reductase